MAPDNPEWSFPNRATPLGSASYYAVRFSPQADRLGAARLLAWYQLIDEIGHHPKDPGVARLKLDWWREETANTVQGNARHPLMTALNQHGLNEAALSPMLSIIDMIEQEIRHPTLHSDDDFHAACLMSGGSLFELFCHVASEKDYNIGRCRKLGTYYSAVERIRFSAERPQRLPISIGNLNAQERHDRFEALTNDLEQGPMCSDKEIPSVARKLIALTHAVHRKMHRTDYAVDDRLIDRPPIAHLWTAWRCR